MRPTKAEIEASNQYIRQLYGGRCVRCRRPGCRAVHEIVPRSQLPGGEWIAVSNRVILCGDCHELVHRTGTAAAADELRRLQAVALGLNL